MNNRLGNHDTRYSFKGETMRKSATIRFDSLNGPFNDISVVVVCVRVKTSRQDVLLETLELTVTTDDIDSKTTSFIKARNLMKLL